MQETEYANITLAFTTQSCFLVPKDFRLNSTHYLIELLLIILQMLIIKISCRITENLQKIHILFGLLLLHCKMKLVDKIKTLNYNIKANEAQYSLDKDAAKSLHCQN